MAKKKKTKAERKAKRKEFFNKAKAAVKKVASAPAKAAVFAATIPFKPVMVSMLKKRGITPEKKQSELVKQFFNNVIQKDSLESGQENLVEDVVEIVKAVVGFFKGKKDRLKAKEEAGEELTEGEKNLVDNVDAIEQAAKEEIKEGIKTEAGKKVVSTFSNPIVLIGIAAAAYFVIKRK